MNLTPDQQKAAYANYSVVVTAGAGTGKTHLLTERFLFYLQNRHISPLEIVAVTFTEKAAIELRSRIRSLIKTQLSDRIDILAELEAAQISTIHGLASRICAEFSEIVGIPADFSVLEDSQGKIWLQQHIDLALANLPVECFTTIPYSLMKECINSLLNDPHTAEKAFQQGIQDWQRLIDLNQQAALEELVNHKIWQKSRDILLNNISSSGDKLETIRQDVVEAIEKLEKRDNSSNSIAVIEKIKVNVGSKKNWQDITLVKNALKDIRELLRSFLQESPINLELTEADSRLKKILPALTEAYFEVHQNLTELKRKAKVLTFSDLETYAIKALSYPHVRDYYRQRWQVFLVDEFQDTNPTQAEFIKALTGDAELTIVGDLKQSIYGFRRADIQVFQDFRQQILANAGQEVILSTSFRTHQPLIGLINRIFQPLLGEMHQDLKAYREFAPLGDEGTGRLGDKGEKGDKGDWETRGTGRLGDKRDGETGRLGDKEDEGDNGDKEDGGTGRLGDWETRETGRQGDKEDEKGIANPYIRVLVVEGDKETDKSQRQRIEAGKIAQQIKQALDNKTLVHDKETQTLRPIEPGDILVLTRTWKPLEIYGEAIAALGIPIAPAGGGNLLTTREAKDCWALLRFLADPEDEIALIAVLRSPWFTVSDRILMSIAQIRKPNAEKELPAWWECIQNASHSELDYPVKVLKELLTQRDCDPPSRLLKKSDRATGYTAIMANLPEGRRRLADWQGFCEFVKELEVGTQDIFGVVRDLKQLYESEAQIARPPLELENAVGLMTIYAAKGLERSFVVVADLSKESPPSYPMVYFSRKWGMAVKSKDNHNNYQKPVLYQHLEKERNKEQKAEAIRVLYVALTRARDYLLLTANSRDKGDLKLLAPGLAAAEIAVETISIEETIAQHLGKAEIAETVHAPLPPIPEGNPTLLIDSVGSGIFELPVTALTEYARCPYRFQFQYLQGHPGIGEGISYGMEIGSLVHKALEHNIKDKTHLMPFCSRDWQPETITEALTLVDDFLNSNIYKKFRDTATEKEHPVNLQIKQINFSGVVDLLGKDWLLDYKSDRIMNPLEHRLQIWAYAKALGYKEAHIAYLRHNLVYSFQEKELNAIAQEAEELVTEIVAGNYNANASLENCSVCPYNSLCEYAVDDEF